MIGIYKITSPSGKVYIGQSWNIFKRFDSHKRILHKRKCKFYSSLKSYGWENHVKSIIHELPEDFNDQEILDNYEILYMELYEACGIELLNLKTGGSHGKHNEETKLKIGKASLGNKYSVGKKLSEEHKELLRMKASLRKHSKESILKMCRIQQQRSQKTKDKLSKSLKGRKPSELALINTKLANNRIIFDLSTGIYYEGVREASFAKDLNYNTLVGRLNGTKKNNTTLRYV